MKTPVSPGINQEFQLGEVAAFTPAERLICDLHRYVNFELGSNGTGVEDPHVTKVCKVIRASPD